MEYIMLNNAQTEELSDFLPEDIRRKLKDGNACVIGGAQKEILVCIGVFSLDEFSENNVECLYLYTNPDSRNQGNATGLILYAEELFAEKGFRRMCFNLTADPETLDGWSRFLSELGYLPVDMDWQIFQYDLTAIEENPLVRRFTGREFSLHTLDQRQISYMLHEDKHLPRKIKDIIRNEADWDKSLFYPVQGHLAAGVMIQDNGVDDLSIHALYISSHLKNRSILLVMLARAVGILGTTKNRRAKVYFYVERENQAEAYEKIFGKPGESYQVQRLEKAL